MTTVLNRPQNPITAHSTQILLTFKYSSHHSGLIVLLFFYKY